MMKIGDTVWFNDKYIGITAGIIENVKHDEQNGDYYVLNIYAGHRNVLAKNCYTTENACETAKHEQIKANIKEYKNNIKNMKDLVNFALTHKINICADYGDYAAREAYIERAKELGIEITVEN